MNGGLIDVTVNEIMYRLYHTTGAGPEQFYLSVDSSDIIDLIYSPGIGQKRTVM